MAKPIPDGFHTLAPHIVVKGAATAIEFYKKAFGATENSRLIAPGRDTVMHAQMTVGDSAFMIGEEFPPNTLSPKTRGGTTVFLHLYVEDADAVFDRATKAGCSVRLPLTDMFWGDRYGIVQDPFGHQWAIATHKQDFTQEQVAENAKAVFARMAKK